jgi:hypothetical protein
MIFPSVLKVQGGDTRKTRYRLKARQIIYYLVGLGALYFAYTNYIAGNTQAALFLGAVGLLSFYLGHKD